MAVLPTLVCAQVPIAELLGKFNPSEHPGFVKIDAKHTEKRDIYLRKEAYEAFEKMAAHAKKDGFTLQVISATRTFEHQKSIWNRKWNHERYREWQPLEIAKDIMKYSSMPGTSRHHWGTDIDLNALENHFFETGKGQALYRWLCKHAASYGYYQVYTSKVNGRTGYAEEKWHWSYLPLASTYLDQYTTQVTAAELSGFKGSELANTLNVVELFVKGIEVKSAGCLPE